MRAVVIVGLVACATRPAPSVESAVEPIRLTSLAPSARRFPPPDVEVVSLYAIPPAGVPVVDPLWPLERSPIVSPHAPLDGIYGTGSLGALCSARGRARGVDAEVALAYVTAWCQGDRHRALADLGRLVKSSDRVIAAAARKDVIDLLVVTGTAGRAAIQWLDARMIITAHDLDRLAATYDANDRGSDAFVVTRRAQKLGAGDPEAIRCMRTLLARRLDPGTHRDELQLEWGANNDPRCGAPAPPTCPLAGGRWVSCANPGCELDLIERDLEQCAREVARVPERMPAIHLYVARRHWPGHLNVASEWLRYAGVAARGIAAPQGPELVLAALVNAALVSDCTEPSRREIAEAARSFAIDTVTSDRVALLRRLTWDDCLALRRR